MTDNKCSPDIVELAAKAMREADPLGRGYRGDWQAYVSQAIAALSVAQTAPSPDQAWRDSVWLGLSASEKACYHWPDDTDLHRQCRAAYIAGATDYAVCPPVSSTLRTTPIDHSNEECPNFPGCHCVDHCCDGWKHPSPEISSTDLGGSK